MEESGCGWRRRGDWRGPCEDTEKLSVSRDKWGRLISSSSDGTVRAWSTETQGCVQTVEAYPAGSQQFIYRLVVSRPTLVGGSVSVPRTESEEHGLRVWDLETLRPLHAIKTPADGPAVCFRSLGTWMRCGWRWVAM